MTDKLFEINQKTIEKDNGSIILYQRPDHKDPKWQSRIKIDGSTGYVRRSCKTTDQDKARMFAENLYNDLVFKQRQTGSIKTKIFKKVVQEYLTDLEHSNKSQKSIQDIKSKLENYSVKYFSGKYITEITSSSLYDFIQWRREKGIRKKPTEITIKKELSPLKQVFKYAYQKQYIESIPDFPIVTGRSIPRPHFTKKEYKRLNRNLREWLKVDHKRIYRDRFYLYQYILVLSNSGIRIGECRELKWKDLDYITTADKQKQLTFFVTGKTRKRQVIPQPFTERYINRIRKYRTEELGKEPPNDEYIFCNSNGEKVGSYKKGFENFLKEYNLLYDLEGNRHTLYSLRHTYATMRIEEGVEHYLLAQNMGTSVEMLEKFYVKLSMASMADEITKYRNR